VPKGLGQLGLPAHPMMPCPVSDRENDYAWPLQYQIIDLKAGTRRALIDSPRRIQRDIVDQCSGVVS